MQQRRNVILIIIVAVGAVALAGCGDDDSPATPSGATLSISGRAFGSVTATAGQPITIVNEDGFAHTVTDRDGAFDVKVPGGDTGTLTIDQPGTYSIYCTIHPDMARSITVG
jgi:plastocyanin